MAPAGAPWQGFQTAVEGTVVLGTPLTLLLDVTLKDGVTPGGFADQLRLDGILGTGKMLADGSVDPQHVHFRHIGLTTVSLAPQTQRPIEPAPRVQP